MVDSESEVVFDPAFKRSLGSGRLKLASFHSPPSTPFKLQIFAISLGPVSDDPDSLTAMRLFDSHPANEWAPVAVSIAKWLQ